MGKKRSERSPHSTPSSAPSTPSAVVVDTPPLPDDGTPALKAPKKESTTAPGTTGTTIPTAMAPAVATSVGMTPARRFIATPNTVYALSAIPRESDFTGGIIRARCTSATCVSRCSKTTGAEFFVMELVLTQEVSRLLTGYASSRAQLPNPLPSVGDFVQVSGVQVEAAKYDGCLYGDIQFVTTRAFALKVVQIPIGDPRIPANWSTTSVTAIRGPAVDASNFF